MCSRTRSDTATHTHTHTHGPAPPTVKQCAVTRDEAGTLQQQTRWTRWKYRTLVSLKNKTLSQLSGNTSVSHRTKRESQRIKRSLFAVIVSGLCCAKMPTPPTCTSTYPFTIPRSMPKSRRKISSHTRTRVDVHQQQQRLASLGPLQSL